MGKSAARLCVIAELLLLLGVFAYQLAGMVEIKLLRNHVPDFFWASAFCTCLIAVSLPCSIHKVTGSAAICVLIGSIFEVLQKMSVIDGTGDVLDVIAYAAGAVCITGIMLVQIKRRVPI